MPLLPMPLWLAVLLFFGSLILGSVGALFGMSHGEANSLDQLSWVSAGAVCAQIPIVFVYMMFVKPPEIKRSIRVVAITFFIFAPLALATSGVLHAAFSSIGWENESDLGHETLQLLQISEFSSAMVVVVIAVTVGAGIVEEIVFRGLLLPSIPLFFRGVSVFGAMLVTSLIFALMHLGSVPLSALIGLVVLSIGLCWARAKSGGVFAPIFVHILFNTLNIAFVL